jgi:hypothetical protein
LIYEIPEAPFPVRHYSKAAGGGFEGITISLFPPFIAGGENNLLMKPVLPDLSVQTVVL